MLARLRPRHLGPAAAVTTLAAVLAIGGTARGQVVPTPDASFQLEPVDECVVGSCSPRVIYGIGFFTPGGFRVEVDWDVPGGQEEAFAPDAAVTCGDSNDPAATPDGECVLQGPAYETAGSKNVGLRVTGADGMPSSASSELEVATQPSPQPLPRIPTRPRGRSP